MILINGSNLCTEENFNEEKFCQIKNQILKNLILPLTLELIKNQIFIISLVLSLLKTIIIVVCWLKTITD